MNDNIVQAISLVREYNAVMAGAYPGDENEILEKIEKLCDVELAFNLAEGDY